MALDAIVHRVNGTSTEVKITDLTNEGCRVEGNHGLDIGEHLEIAIPGVGKLKAQIRWALQYSAGARFID